MPGGLDLGTMSATVPQDIDDAGLGAAYFRTLYTKMQAQLAPISSGLFSARPAAGNAGRIYVATDSDVVYVDSGTTWKRAVTGTGAINSDIADAAITTIKLAAAAVTAAKIDDSLKPSGTAAAGDEALRAIGTGSGQVAAGGSHTFSGNVRTNTNLTVDGASTLTGNATVGGTLGVTGDTTVAALIASALATLSAGAVAPARINAQTGTTYTLVLADQSKTLTLSNAAAITLTVPANASVAFPTGTLIDLVQTGAGQVTIAPDTGVTITSYQGKTKIAGQHAAVTLLKTGTNAWTLIGNLG